MVYLLVGLARRVTFLPIVIVAVAILGACSRAPEQKPAAPASKPEPDTVTISTEAQVRFGFAVARPQRITPVRFIEATAAIAPDPARVSHIAPIAKGRIERVYVQVGDAVNQGTPFSGTTTSNWGRPLGTIGVSWPSCRRTSPSWNTTGRCGNVPSCCWKKRR